MSERTRGDVADSLTLTVEASGKHFRNGIEGRYLQEILRMVRQWGEPPHRGVETLSFPVSALVTAELFRTVEDVRREWAKEASFLRPCVRCRTVSKFGEDEVDDLRNLFLGWRMVDGERIEFSFSPMGPWEFLGGYLRDRMKAMNARTKTATQDADGADCYAGEDEE